MFATNEELSAYYEVIRHRKIYQHCFLPEKIWRVLTIKDKLFAEITWYGYEETLKDLNPIEEPKDLLPAYLSDPSSVDDLRMQIQRLSLKSQNHYRECGIS